MRKSLIAFLSLLYAAVALQTVSGFLASSTNEYLGAVVPLRTLRDEDAIVQSDINTDGSVRIYFDIAVEDEGIGRLVFVIPDQNLLPLHIENILKLCTQARSSIDPRCKYIGCEFQHSPQFVEGFAQYRWSHTLKGRGRNAVGVSDGRISDPDNMRKCTHSIYGGQYYGLNYAKDIPREMGGDDNNNAAVDTRVVLSVPLVGPGRGSTDIAIIRVGESPPEWKERLLLNSAVLGWMDPSSMDTLKAMARQTRGPPKVIGSGVLE